MSPILLQQLDILVEVGDDGILGLAIRAFTFRCLDDILLGPADEIDDRNAQDPAYLLQAAIGDVALAGDEARIRALLDAQLSGDLLLLDVLRLANRFYVFQYAVQ